MAMVCPKCKGAFDQRIYCPKCHVHLNYHEAQSRGFFSRPIGPWQQTPWGRIVLGLIVAQGLFYALRKFVTAGALASGTEDEELWSTMGGVLLLQGMQVLTLILGGMMAGATQRQGFVYGAVLGIWNGVLSLLLYPEHTSRFMIHAYGQPLIHAAFGGLGGWLGSFIWKPLSEPATAHPQKPVEPKKRKKLFLRTYWTGPLFWGRIITGSAVAIGGTIWADVILDMIEDTGGSDIKINTHFQAQLLTWEITALAMMGGAALAGATTFNGLKQGFTVGALSTVVLIGIRMSHGQSSLLIFLLASVSPMILCSLGGLFGCQLLPPLLKKSRKALWDIP